MNIPHLRRATGEWFDQMRQEMDQLMHRFLKPAERAAAADSPWRPDIDVAEGPDALVVKVDLPGVDASDCEIAVAEGNLVIRGMRKEERTQTGVNFHFMERPLGPFFRAIPLPAGTDPESIQATCTRGLLTVTVPKKSAVQERKIHIHTVE